MPRNAIPAILVWCEAWEMDSWQSLTGMPRPPRSDSAAFSAWRSSLLNLATIDDVQASFERMRSQEISIFSGLVTKCLNKCGLWDVITQFMIDRKFDAASIAMQLGSCQPPRSLARWFHPHINALGLALLGPEAKQSDLSDVVNDRVYALSSELLKIAFERQSKRMQYSQATFWSARENLERCIEGMNTGLNGNSCKLTNQIIATALHPQFIKAFSQDSVYSAEL